MVTTHYAGTPYLGLYRWNEKLVIKISGYKMSKAIKSRDFNTSLLSLGAPEWKKN